MLSPNAFLLDLCGKTGVSLLVQRAALVNCFFDPHQDTEILYSAEGQSTQV